MIQNYLRDEATYVTVNEKLSRSYLLISAQIHVSFMGGIYIYSFSIIIISKANLKAWFLRCPDSFPAVCVHVCVRALVCLLCLCTLIKSHNSAGFC